MLTQCSACLISRPGERLQSLQTLAADVGFGSISSTAQEQGGQQGLASPILFFLMDGQLDETAMARTLAAVRQSPAERICFAPVVLLIEDGPFETYLRYVHMGFDDVITIPEKRELVIQRLDNQLGEHLYFRTPTYLGPDRRRFDLLTTAPERRSRGPSDHEELTILRSALTGIRVVRTQQFIASHPARIAS